MVPEEGLEPSILAALVSKTSVYTFHHSGTGPWVRTRTSPPFGEQIYSLLAESDQLYPRFWQKQLVLIQIPYLRYAQFSKLPQNPIWFCFYIRFGGGHRDRTGNLSIGITVFKTVSATHAAYPPSYLSKGKRLPRSATQAESITR